ncbi:hypothetical protein [Halobacteriovorax sp. ZH2_bin.1]|uniref:hypothetical protein n=1 Tax=unclassified Halobacteriovorax TaxID=2639665 RepID=UPI003719AFB9
MNATNLATENTVTTKAIAKKEVLRVISRDLNARIDELNRDGEAVIKDRFKHFVNKDVSTLYRWAQGDTFPRGKDDLLSIYKFVLNKEKIDVTDCPPIVSRYIISSGLQYSHKNTNSRANAEEVQALTELLSRSQLAREIYLDTIDNPLRVTTLESVRREYGERGVRMAEQLIELFAVQRTSHNGLTRGRVSANYDQGLRHRFIEDLLKRYSEGKEIKTQEELAENWKGADMIFQVRSLSESGAKQASLILKEAMERIIELEKTSPGSKNYQVGIVTMPT